MNEAVEVLQALIAHPGWKLFTQQVRGEWMQRELIGRRNALNGTDDQLALAKLRQITAAQEAVEWAVEWPSNEIERLKRLEMGPVEVNYSRRGSL